MTDIYVDPSVASMSGAAGQLAHLLDTGHRLILVGDCPTSVRDHLPAAAAVDALPGAVSSGSWRLSDDPASCGERLPGLQILLVGPRLAASPQRMPRCDAAARDLAAAVLEILGREVMG